LSRQEFGNEAWEEVLNPVSAIVSLPVKISSLRCRISFGKRRRAKRRFLRTTAAGNRRSIDVTVLSPGDDRDSVVARTGLPAMDRSTIQSDYDAVGNTPRTLTFLA
jgi:hypothetical protein